MIDPSRTKVFRFESPADCLTRKHRYLVYFKKRFLGRFYKIDDAYSFINKQPFDSFVLSWQYLGYDGYFHTFQREYLYTVEFQLSMFN